MPDTWVVNASPVITLAKAGHLDNVDYIMKTFPIVKCKGDQQYGEYRTKRVILEIYDAMCH